MAVQTTEIKDGIRLAWLSFLEALYTFSPWQRVVLFVAACMIVFGFFIFKIGTKLIYDHTYKEYHLEARPAFTNPLLPTVGDITVLALSGGRFTAFANVTNNNLDLAGTEGRYRVVFSSATGSQVYETSGSLFMAPGKSTYIVVPSFLPEERPTKGRITVDNIQWQKKLAVPEVTLSAPVPIKFADGSGTRLEGFMINSSPYGLGKARVVVLLYDKFGKVLGVSDHSAFSILPRERRAYVLRFPEVDADSIHRIVPVVETNIFDVSNIQVPDDTLPIDTTGNGADS